MAVFLQKYVVDEEKQPNFSGKEASQSILEMTASYTNGEF